MLNYAVSLERRYDGLFIATFPDLPEAVAYGRDDEEALEEAEITLKATLNRLGGAGGDPASTADRRPSQGTAEAGLAAERT